LAVLYSKSWHRIKIKPKIIVNPKPNKTWVLFVEISALWAHVKLKPEDNNRIVLTRGNPKGSISWISSGGQIFPIQMEGFKDALKKAKKKQKKT